MSKLIVNHLDKVLAEKERAETLHPGFLQDAVHMVAVMSEEAGEAVQATLNYHYHNGSIEDAFKETIQTIVTGFRYLEYLEMLKNGSENKAN